MPEPRHLERGRCLVSRVPASGVLLLAGKVYTETACSILFADQLSANLWPGALAESHLLQLLHRSMRPEQFCVCRFDASSSPSRRQPCDFSHDTRRLGRCNRQRDRSCQRGRAKDRFGTFRWPLATVFMLICIHRDTTGIADF